MACRGPKPVDLTGYVFGRLTVKREASRRGQERYWVCVCECGTTKDVRQVSLKAGITQSCGCLQKEVAAGVARMRATHGMYGTPIYRVYRAMLARCTNSASSEYSNYGGRGIKVCNRWTEGFEAFYADMGDRPSPKHSIDRIDPNGNYEPTNCRWATAKEQANNTRRTKVLTAKGRTLPVSEWAQLLGLSQKTIWTRLGRGLSDEQALQPVGGKR